VLSAARNGHPAAYGTARLRAARQTIIDHIETLNEQPAAGPGQPAATGLEDPLQALVDLDRVVTDAADRRVTPRLVKPTRADAISADLQHQHFVQAGYQPPAHSAGIQL
jgi:hypothetical protein